MTTCVMNSASIEREPIKLARCASYYCDAQLLSLWLSRHAPCGAECRGGVMDLLRAPNQWSPYTVDACWGRGCAAAHAAGMRSCSCASRTPAASLPSRRGEDDALLLLRSADAAVVSTCVCVFFCVCEEGTAA